MGYAGSTLTGSRKRQKIEMEEMGEEMEEKKGRKQRGGGGRGLMWRRRAKVEEGQELLGLQPGSTMAFVACGAERSGDRLGVLSWSRIECAGWLHTHQWNRVLVHPGYDEGRQF